MLRNPFVWFKVCWAVLKQIRRQKPDIIHIATDPYALAFPLIPRKLLPHWVFTACGTYAVSPFDFKKTRLMMLQVYRKTSQVLSISQYTKGRILDRLKKEDPQVEAEVAKKISTFTLGIESSVTPANKTDQKQKRLLFVGNVKPRKGVAEIISACGVFHSKNTLPFHLDIMGLCEETKYIDQLHSLIKENKLDNYVTIHGKVSSERLEQAYEEADLFLMLSKSTDAFFEGFGLVFLEANAYGIPVIGPDNSGCTDAISDGVSGYTVDPTDAETVAERIKWILMEERIDPLSCRKWAEDHSIERQAKEVESIYEKVLL